MSGRVNEKEMPRPGLRDTRQDGLQPGDESQRGLVICQRFLAKTAVHGSDYDYDYDYEGKRFDAPGGRRLLFP